MKRPKADRIGALGSIEELQRELTGALLPSSVEELQRQFAAALEQQAATTRILEVINTSGGDLQPVYQAVVDAAQRLLLADAAGLYRVAGSELETVALGSGVRVPGLALGDRVPIDPATVAGAAALERRTVHVPDVRRRPDLPQNAPLARLGVPILHQTDVVGVITVAHADPQPFGSREISLLETFAGQVGIAIENARLLNETKEGFERQTALGEILRVIAASPSDIQPVLDAIAVSAKRFCAAEDVVVHIREGDRLFARAHIGDIPASDLKQFPASIPLDASAVPGHAATEKRTIHVPDIRAGADYPLSRAISEETGHRATLATPMLRGDEAIGTILLRRLEPRPFSPRQIELVETFAAQAAIAIENVRLFNETKEALEREAASADILEAISRSTNDVAPVLETALSHAVRLCRAQRGAIYLREGDGLRFTAHSGWAPEWYVEELRTRPAFEIGDSSIPGRTAAAGKPVMVEDVLTIEDGFRPIRARAGFRTVLGVPLMRGDDVLGVFSLSNTVVRPFTQAEIELVRTFADQVVIAIENVRLFNETKEALEQQKATSEVLGVISRTTSDVVPVIEAAIASATRLLGEEVGTGWLIAEGGLKNVAQYVAPEDPGATTAARARRKATLDFVKLYPAPIPISRASIAGRAILERRSIQVADVFADPEHGGHEGEEDSYRAVLAVPLLREGEPLGAITFARPDTRLWTERQVRLAEGFAEQIVIAIENVRLFNETKEALEQQTATAEILRVIAKSPTDVQPVLDAITKSAATFCAAEDATVGLLDGSMWSIRSHYGPVEINVEHWDTGSGSRTAQRPLSNDFVSGHAMIERRTVHVSDLQSEEARARYPTALLASPTARAIVATPLLRNAEPIGALFLRRRDPTPFTERQIQLVETFADQAVIAIENVRLFNETKDALARQTAVAEVLATISRSVFDLEPILTTVIQNAVKLCGAKGGLIFRRQGEDYRLEAMYGGHPRFVDYFKERVLHPGRQAVTMRAVTVGEPVQIADVEADPDYEHTAVREFEPFRTILGIPLLHQGKPIGAMSLWRNEVREFSPAEIELVRTFADQAAIAIENVRLFNETKEALEQQRAVAEVLKTISRSVFDLRPVLDAVVENAARLAQADFAWLSQMIGDDEYKVVAQFGSAFSAPEVMAEWRQLGVRRVASSPSLMGRVLRARQQLHVADISADPDLREGSPLIRATGARTILAVPMLREGRPIGGVVAGRADVRPFSDREVELVQTFADQAAIAIENVRLFNEIQDKSRQLEVASRHKSEFMANMSHELRTPLNAIIGFTDVMLEEMFGTLNDKQKEYLEDVRNSGTHLLTLINDILDLSKVEAGRVELDIAEFSFPEALDNALTLVRERATRHGITLASDVAKDVGTISADERKIKQILVNLLANAVKFTPDGGRVTVRARRLNGEIEVAVHDTGIGVAIEDQERIFDEFQQVGRDPERSREGTGLGLTLAKRFVELHGGRIWVESEVGKGSTFTFAIPVRQRVPSAQ